MFIRPNYRTKNGKRHAYWALMESYRTARGPRQRVVAYLGQLDEPERLGMKDAAQGGRRSRQRRLFDDVRPQWVEVDAARLRVENCCDFGRPWLGLELVKQLGLKEFLDETLPRGAEEVPWSWMALVLVLCRMCEPSSELHIVEHFYAHSALAELLGVPAVPTGSGSPTGAWSPRRTSPSCSTAGDATSWARPRACSSSSSGSYSRRS